MGRIGRRAVLSSVALATLALAAAPLRADTLHVPGDSPTIQGAIVMASSGDTILVAPGTYVETIDLVGKQLVIEGTGGAAATTLDASGGGSVVTLRGAEPAGTALRGFTLTGGDGQELSPGWQIAGGAVYVGPGAVVDLVDCTITGNTLAWYTGMSHGGGVYVDDATATLVGCTLAGNVAWRGAALSCENAGRIVLEDCTVSSNTSVPNQFGNIGSAVYASGRLEMSGCAIVDNLGVAGVWTNNNPYAVQWDDCVFSGNQGWGYTAFAPIPRLTGCSFLGNELGGASIGSGAFAGAGADVSNCIFAEGDELYLNNNVDGENYIDRCTFDGTTLRVNNGGAYLVDCIMRGGTRHFDVPDGTVSADYSDIEGGFAGDSDIDADPLWVDAANHDYRLEAGSPCIDTGDPDSFVDPDRTLDPDGTPPDMGAIAFENAFDDLGGGVAGTAGPVVLAAHSTLIGGEGVVFKLSGTTPFKPTLMILGASSLGAPFKGGTMWPALNSVISGLVTSGTGQLTLSTTWPAAIPSGFSLWAQFWFPDAGAVSGFAGSNGVRGTVP